MLTHQGYITVHIIAGGGPHQPSDVSSRRASSLQPRFISTFKGSSAALKTESVIKNGQQALNPSPSILMFETESTTAKHPLPLYAYRKGLLELFGPEVVETLQDNGNGVAPHPSGEHLFTEPNYFEPADTAYLSPPWDSATCDECKVFLAEVRRSSLRLSNEYLEALKSGSATDSLETALGRVFSSTIVGSNSLEGLGLPEEDTRKLCNAYLEGEIDSEDEAFNSESTSVEIRKRREVLNHVRAFVYLKQKIRQTKELSEEVLLQTHEILLENDYSECLQHGEYRSTYCIVGSARLLDKEGEEITTTEPHEIPKLMTAWIDKYNKALSMGPDKQEVLFTAASLVKDFLVIHPFQDGNGRLVRILENSLVSAHYPFVLLPHEIQPKSRRNYIQSIRAAIKKDRPQFLAYRSLKSAWKSTKILRENSSEKC